MNTSKLIEQIINQSNSNIPITIIKKAVKEIINYLIINISNGNRIEIRGFGSFSLHPRIAYFGYNPKTKKKIFLKEKLVPFFKPGKKLKNRVNNFSK